jgi:hypothetical protein
MQEERRSRTREALKAPVRGETMKPTGLGHERVKSPDTACARVESSSKERTGRRETAACRRGVLSGIVVGGRESRPAGVRTRRKHAARKGNSCRTCRIGSTRANLTAGTKQLGRATGNCDGPLDKLVQPRNRMRENRKPRSVAGAPGNRSPYAGGVIGQPSADCLY